LPVGQEAGVHAALGAESDDAEADVLLRHGVSVLWWCRAPGRGRGWIWGERGARGGRAGGTRSPTPSSLYASADPWPGPPTHGDQACSEAEAAAAACRSSRSATFSSTRLWVSGYRQSRASSETSSRRAGTRGPRG